jgi:site-specific recombinase XerC
MGHAHAQYLLEARALSRATILNYVTVIRCFLEQRFGRGRVTLWRLSAGDVVRFVQRQAPRVCLKRAKLMTSALRSFLRYARYLGEISLDLAAAVPIVANGRWPRSRGRLRQIRYVSSWPASIAAARSGVATMRYCFCSRDWAGSDRASGAS